MAATPKSKAKLPNEGSRAVVLCNRSAADLEISAAGLLDQVFEETPFLGRSFLPGEAVAGKEYVVILTNQLWRDRFGSDPQMIGRGAISIVSRRHKRIA